MLKLKRKDLLCAQFSAPVVTAWNPDDDVKVDVLQDDGKTLVSELHRQTNDPYKIKALKASDFSLQNLAAVGAVDSLRPSFLKNDDMFMNAQTLESLDNLSSLYDKIESAASVSQPIETPSTNEES